MSVTLTARQLAEAALLFGGGSDEELTISRNREGKLYIWCTEYPEEGSVQLEEHLESPSLFQ